MNLNSLDIENNMPPQHIQKPFWIYKFSSKHVSVWRQKNIWAAPFLDTKELHSWSTLKGYVCIFLYISVRKFLFQRRSKILSDGRRVGGGGLGIGGDWIIL